MVGPTVTKSAYFTVFLNSTSPILHRMTLVYHLYGHDHTFITFPQYIVKYCKLLSMRTCPWKEVWDECFIQNLVRTLSNWRYTIILSRIVINIRNFVSSLNCISSISPFRRVHKCKSSDESTLTNFHTYIVKHCNHYCTEVRRVQKTSAQIFRNGWDSICLTVFSFLKMQLEKLVVLFVNLWMMSAFFVATSDDLCSQWKP